MGVYPLQIRKVTWPHKGGTKEYHLHEIVDLANNRSVLIKRWGKVGSFGQIKVEYGDIAAMSEIVIAITRDKRANGYDISTKMEEREATSFADLPGKVGRALFPKIGKEALSFIDPDADVSGMREADQPDFDEDGNRLAKAARVPSPTYEQLEVAAAIEREKERKLDENHPNFGLFN